MLIANKTRESWPLGNPQSQLLLATFRALCILSFVKIAIKNTNPLDITTKIAANSHQRHGYRSYIHCSSHQFEQYHNTNLHHDVKIAISIATLISKSFPNIAACIPYVLVSDWLTRKNLATKAPCEWYNDDSLLLSSTFKNDCGRKGIRISFLFQKFHRPFSFQWAFRGSVQTILAVLF